ncbi:Hypothetical predicted protein [Octopus vulgaris]|uniref:Uncharacterized protein n=1 Tax=Octopus vulgaris TaxID=6645 RepID=A0AA36FDC4_OCTVU|nr:Hypothetical predicted protein [Octopus vulgaris]
MSTRSASGTGTSSGAEKYLGKLGVVMVVGVGGAIVESADADDDGAAAVVAGVLVAVVSVGRSGVRLSFSFSLGQETFKCSNQLL